MYINNLYNLYKKNYWHNSINLLTCGRITYERYSLTYRFERDTMYYPIQ